MNLDLSDEQETFRRTVRSFAEEVVAPQAEEADREERFPIEVARAMGDLGLFGVPFAVEHGGQGGDLLTFCLALEELARVDSSVAVTLAAAVGLAGGAVSLFGTDDQKQRWLAPLARGDGIGAFALSEPDAGSDISALWTTARLEDGEWVIEGTKAFTTNAGTPLTAFCVVTAATGEREDGTKEASMLVVPIDARGLSVGPPYRKLGWRASDTRELVFRDCRVPEDHLLGERGAGIAQCLRVLDGGRVGIAALSVGLAQGCLDASLAYAAERRAFGHPIGAFQALRHKLADMRVAIDAARLMTHRAAWLRDRGRPFTAEAAEAKLFASEAAVECAREAVQVHGGSGYMEESPVARHYRDAKILEIGEGTSEIQRTVIARELGLPEPA